MRIKLAVISNKFKFIYILNPRTASTATAQALIEQAEGFNLPAEPVRNNNGEVVVPTKHTTLNQLLKYNLVDDETMKRYFKFLTVRNPYDSVVVVSLWAKNTNDYVHLLNDPKSWVHSQPGRAEKMRRAAGQTFPEWACDVYSQKLSEGRKGSLNMKYMKGSDSVMRFENLHEDFDLIKAKLGMPDSFKIPIKNVTSGRKGVKDYRSFYDNKSKELVAEFFAEEINALGYSF